MNSLEKSFVYMGLVASQMLNYLPSFCGWALKVKAQLLWPMMCFATLATFRAS
jgi:hypothetical protein